MSNVNIELYVGALGRAIEGRTWPSSIVTATPPPPEPAFTKLIPYTNTIPKAQPTVFSQIINSAQGKDLLQTCTSMNLT